MNKPMNCTKYSKDNMILRKKGSASVCAVFTVFIAFSLNPIHKNFRVDVLHLTYTYPGTKTNLYYLYPFTAHTAHQSNLLIKGLVSVDKAKHTTII